MKKVVAVVTGRCWKNQKEKQEELAANCFC